MRRFTGALTGAVMASVAEAGPHLHRDHALTRFRTRNESERSAAGVDVLSQLARTTVFTCNE